MFKNPYSIVRGRHDQPQSLDAVRSLLTLVPVEPTGFGRSDSLTKQDSVDESIASLDSSPNVLPLPHHTIVSKSETASQLAEGTLRALRDITLDEAVELHDALRYWTIRWERPLLSWLEAGPWGTYNAQRRTP